ncbi:hypothetical protein AQUCO_00400569v1 [Aquilegia coerulea]|uniref:TLC domain-containing protein n=1 Tax=Aquilegia coerulea TaxID=218851 RepID=A0A2G5EVJ4_AQUCA|nr:hypothetical protein AQUCO_00400569v1 [Aquilegia coerulea]
MDLENLIGSITKNDQELWLMCVMVGILMCNIVYRVTGLISLTCFDCYAKLTKLQKMEWNNRGFSTFHAFVAAGGALYLLIWSDLFVEGSESMSSRKSVLSDSILGISIGYFLSDLGMILWYYPILGGLEYVLHHGLSLFSIILSLISGQGQIYILMVLFTESTTPFVNLRWYLDVAKQKNSKLYICNGIAMFLGWLVARILLFIYFFVHMYLHFDQVCLLFEVIG